MKLTKELLKKIIKEEIGEITELELKPKISGGEYGTPNPDHPVGEYGYEAWIRMHLKTLKSKLSLEARNNGYSEEEFAKAWETMIQ